MPPRRTRHQISRDLNGDLKEDLFEFGLSLDVDTFIVILVKAGLGGIFGEDLFTGELEDDGFGF